MILILTSKRDGHIAAVTRHLDRAGRGWARINIEDFATNTAVEVLPTSGSGRVVVKDSKRVIDLSSVTAVWFRKPDPVCLSHLAVDQAALEYVEAELTEVVHGIYGLLDAAFWINNPFYTRSAHRKMLQLRVATEIGFRVPRSLVTNDDRIALNFCEALGTDIAIKSLGAISVLGTYQGHATQYGVFTRRVTLEELSGFRDKIPHMPTLFQEFVPKTSELRVTCVGENVFGCRITPRCGDITADDYRFDTKGLTHEPVECPELVKRLHAYMRVFGLKFGCFDFIVDQNGEPVFLECNPNGQWLWVEEMAGLPIGAAIAAELMTTIGAGARSSRAAVSIYGSSI
jgi:hypothetical protein